MPDSASPRASQPPSTIAGFDRAQLVRLQLQLLRDCGYTDTADALQRESGVRADDDDVLRFKRALLAGEWADAEALLSALGFHAEQETHGRYWIRRQHYLELLEAGKIQRAIKVLQSGLSSLGVFADDIHQLSSLAFVQDVHELRQRSAWDGAAGSSRHDLMHRLQQYVAPDKMIPEGRLTTLLQQAMDWQARRCRYHNTLEQVRDLYRDHVCDKSRLPTTTLHVLRRHSDEVWHVSYSHSGRYLLSCSKDKTAMVWDLESMIVSSSPSSPLLLRTDHALPSIAPAPVLLEGHMDSVVYGAWSPSDAEVLTCSHDHDIRLWSTASGDCLRVYTKHSDEVVAASWLPSGTRFVSGGKDKVIYLWHRDGTALHKWTGPRVVDLAVASDGVRLVVVSHERKIHLYDLTRLTDEADTMQESGDIMSLRLSASGQRMLVNLHSQDLHEWDLESKTMIKTFFGHQIDEYVVRSSYGGVHESFVACGSEDSKIYIWNRESAEELLTLEGHEARVNCIDWNPHNPFSFASASDDTTIRIWGIQSGA